MQRKLTLSIDEELIKFAHRFAKHSKQSISHMIEEYLNSLRKQKANSDLSKKTQALYGIFSTENIPGKKELRRYFTYGFTN